jgi:hypothetical protein
MLSVIYDIAHAYICMLHTIYFVFYMHVRKKYKGVLFKKSKKTSSTTTLSLSFESLNSYNRKGTNGHLIAKETGCRSSSNEGDCLLPKVPLDPSTDKNKKLLFYFLFQQQTDNGTRALKFFPVYHDVVME